jgi:hypothetical protein
MDIIPRCSIENCRGEYYAKDFCRKHYDKVFVKSSEYRTWQNMKNRCYNKNHPQYPNYGGRGITIFEDWINDFPKFFEYIGQKPTKKHSIDRINNDGNYEPGNVRWATWYQQGSNKRNSCKVTGVHFVKNKNLWSANIILGGVFMFRKQFKFFEDAVKVRKELEKIYGA